MSPRPMRARPISIAASASRRRRRMRPISRWNGAAPLARLCADFQRSATMEFLTAESFLPHVGKKAHFAGTEHTLKLDRVEISKGPIPPGGKYQSFIVIFQGPQRNDYLPSDIYDCEIEDGPTFNIYVAPMQSETPG